MAILKAIDLDELVAMSTLKWGLRSDCLTFSLNRNFPRNYADLLAQAREYAYAKESQILCRQEKGRGDGKKEYS